MSFSVPTFPLAVNLWRGGVSVLLPPSVVTVGNLAWGRRVSSYQGLHNNVGDDLLMTLLLPVGTDVRSPACPSGADTVEVPAGSGRFYTAIGVDDIGKGFSNEHRAAVLRTRAPWPQPIP
jgi:hypothetical protein